MILTSVLELNPCQNVDILILLGILLIRDAVILCYSPAQTRQCAFFCCLAAFASKKLKFACTSLVSPLNR